MVTLFLFWFLLELPKRRPPEDEVLSVVVEVLCLCLAAADVSGRLLEAEDPVVARFLELVPPTSSGAGFLFLPIALCLPDDDDVAELVLDRDRVAGVVA